MQNNLITYFKAEWHLFSLAGSFMSRFFTTAYSEAAELAASVRYYPVLGLLLGLAGLFFLKVLGVLELLPQTTGFIGAAGLEVGGSQASSPHLSVLASLFMGFMYIVWLAFATRGLHWDGWADLGDAYGAASCGSDKFIKALKDSRIGAFGVMALVFGILGQILLSAGGFAQGYFWALAFAPMWGRQAALVLAYCSRRGFCAAPKPGSLGALCVAGAGRRTLTLTMFSTCVAGLFLLPLKVLLLTALFSAGLLYALLRISKRSGVLNGDFLGAAIIGGELCALLAFLAV